MKKIDFSKAEQGISEAVIRMRMKQLGEGKPVTSKQAIEYFGLNEETRPAPEDTVERLLSEEAFKEENPETPLQEGQTAAEEEPFVPAIEEMPSSDTLESSKQRSGRLQKKSSVTSSPIQSSEKFREPSSPLFILKNHLLWLKSQKIHDRYERLGTSREEIHGLEQVERLNENEILHIQKLNSRAEEVKKEVMKEKGITSNEELIEKEQKAHERKRFNVRKTWMPL